MRGWTARKNALVKFETNNQHPIKRDDKKLILSLSVIMAMFLSLPFIQIFFPMERSQKSLPMEAIFTINRYSSQDKTKFSFFNNKSEKMLFGWL